MAETATKEKEPLEELFTLPESARYVKVNEETIRRQIAKGFLPATKILGRWRIRQSDLLKFAAGR